MARMPSTNWLSKNVFTVRPDGRLDLELTTYEVWKKKDVTRGEVPAAWRRPSKGKRDVRETISSVTHYRSE
jgi:hypothetical protein